MTRDSVCAGDDVEAPHDATMAFPDGTTLVELVETIARGPYLPSAGGGEVCRVVESSVPVALVRRVGGRTVGEIRFAPRLPPEPQGLDVVQGTIELFFNYRYGADREAAFDALCADGGSSRG